MGRFFDCQMAIVPWGARAKFRRAKVGLLRKGSNVYIAIFSQLKDNYKFQIDQRSVEILPAAIRFKDLQKDLFIRQVSDEQRYSTMVREIKVLLKKDKLRQTGKGDTLDKLISSIPLFSAIDPCELVPSRVSARIVGVGSGGDDGSGSGCGSLSLQQVAPSGNGYFDLIDVVESPTHSHTIGCIGALSKEQKQRLDNKQLKSIKIRGLDRLPEQLWLKNSLHELTLTNCNLTNVPKQLESFSSTLTYLDLSRNRIDNLPRTFCCKMNNLRLMDLSHNLIEILPIEIKFFCRLVDLNISNNHLRMLPSTFSDLKSLKILNVANNNLSQLPAFRKEDVRLKELDVSHNPLDGALNEASTFEVYPSYDGPLGYHENLFAPSVVPPSLSKNRFPTLFEISMLNIVRCDDLFKLASEESLPRTIVSTMQRDIFKCYKCSRMNILPAYNSTDILDYVEQVEVLTSNGNYRHGMTFMKLMCRSCFDTMSSR